MFKVVPISASATHHLRREVLRNGDPQGVVIWPRDDDATTTHYGAINAVGAIIAIGTIYPQILPENATNRAIANAIDASRQFQFRGMASDASVRGQGAGWTLLQRLIAHAHQQRPALLWCNARVAAIGFYEKAGMQIVSDQFDIAGVGPHFVMARRIW